MKNILLALGITTLALQGAAANAASVCMIDSDQGVLTVVCDGMAVKTVPTGAYPDFLVQATKLEQQYVGQGYRIVGFTNDQGITIILEKDQ